MSDVLYFESGTSLEDRFKLVCSKIEYYFTKIQHYDAVLNEFSVLKKSLEKIVKESEYSVALARTQERISQIQNDHLQQVNQRVSDESVRKDTQHVEVIESIQDLKFYFDDYAIKSDLKMDYIRNEAQAALADYANLKIISSQFDEIEKSIEDLKEKTSRMVRDSHCLENQVVNVQDSVQKLQDKQDQQYKDLCIIQNAMVRLRSEVLK
jgi:hypothetical protein